MSVTGSINRCVFNTLIASIRTSNSIVSLILSRLTRFASRSVAKERTIRSESQLECAVASEGMSAVETQQRLVRRAVPGVDVKKKNAVIGGIAQTSAPRVRRLIGEAVRQAFRQLHIHRVVTR